MVIRALHFLQTQVFTNAKPAQTNNTSKAANQPQTISQDLVENTEIAVENMTDVKQEQHDDDLVIKSATQERTTLKQWLPETIELKNELAKLKYEIDLAASNFKSQK